jgi:hypothetical protein
MRFALKAIPLGVLGVATALLVACGNSNGLLSGGDAGNLQNALSSVQSACANGQTARATLAAQRFSDRVDALSPASVDRRLIANLQQGARTLEQLVTQTCTQSTPTTPTTTTQTTTTPTTTAPTTTAPPTTPSTSTTPTTTTPPSTSTTTGGGTPPGHGGTPPGQGGTPPGQSGGGDSGGGASSGGAGG